MSHHQCTSALVRAKCIPHRLCCSAKQADNIVESLQRHLWIFLQHTGVQCPNFNALQHCSRQNAFLTGCVALQNRLTAVLCHCKDTFGYFFNTQVCSVPSPMHFSTGQGEMHSSPPVLLCKTGRQHCRVIAKTALDISSTHRCAVSQLQCTAALLKTKCIPHCLCCSAKQADSSLVSLQRHLWILLQDTGVQCPITNALQHKSGQKSFLTVQSYSAKQVHSSLVSLQRHLWILLRDTGVQCPITNALQHKSGQKSFLTAQSYSAKQADSRLVSLQIDLWVFAHRTGDQ